MKKDYQGNPIIGKIEKHKDYQGRIIYVYKVKTSDGSKGIRITRFDPIK